MLLFVLFILELIVLFLLSQWFSKALSRFLLRITRSQATTIHIISFIFLPGVIVHELAHWFVAGMLLVRTGEMEFVPQIHENTVKLGSVAIAKTDPFRRFLIGVAPVLVGLVVLFGIFLTFASAVPQFNWQTVLVIYIFFEIGNTMFSSKKDMEGALFLIGFLVLVGIFGYVLGFRIQPQVVRSFFTSVWVVFFLQKVSIMLLFPLFINAAFYLVSKFANK